MTTDERLYISHQTALDLQQALCLKAARLLTRTRRRQRRAKVSVAMGGFLLGGLTGRGSGPLKLPLPDPSTGDYSTVRYRGTGSLSCSRNLGLTYRKVTVPAGT